MRSSLKTRAAAILAEAFHRYINSGLINLLNFVGLSIFGTLILWIFNITSIASVAIAIGLLIVCSVFMIFKVARQKDRGMVPIIAIAIGIPGAMCLVVGTICLISRQDKEIAELTSNATAEKVKRVDIAQAAVRLLKLKDDKVEFEKVVSNADEAWRRVENFKDQLALIRSPPMEMEQAYKTCGTVNLWRGALSQWQVPLFQVLNKITHDLGSNKQFGSQVIGHTDDYDPRKEVAGEGNMTDEGRTMWRDVLNRHLYATTAVLETRSALISEIIRLEQKLDAAARETANVKQ